MEIQAPKERFTGKADVYDKYRPGYPPELLGLLRDAYGLTASWVVADVGSGTGKLTELLLGNGNTVFAVEPNADMRHRAESLFSGRPGFRSVDGSAEATALAPASVDLVAAGQAFHWFDPERCRAEFRRILRPPHLVVLAWNVRIPGGSGFADAYEVFLKAHAGEAYDAVSHRRLAEGDALRGFFVSGFSKNSFLQPRELDFDAVWGAYLSTSYSLPAEHPRHGQARASLRTLFDQHAVQGVVSIPLRTDIYHGRI